MNWKRYVYLGYASLRGYHFPRLLRHYSADYQRRPPGEVTTQALSRLLLHCREAVPYYAEFLEGRAKRDEMRLAPRQCLQLLPILTKQAVRANLSKLQSLDLPTRQWHYNTSGGSTGEPVCLIQDAEYEDRRAATALFFFSRLGCQPCQPKIMLWGSERDLEEHTANWKARFFNWLTTTTFLDAFQMPSQRMREYLQTLNKLRPRLIVAYAQAIYELARFAEREGIAVVPQRAVVTSAGTLYPFMREKLIQVFDCPVFNLYGSREVGDIACEQQGCQGLRVAPWSHFVEIVDDKGEPVPAGTEGNILVTCLTNYAMPLLRYRIGDRGVLSPETASSGRAAVQVLERVSGRTVDAFRTRDQTLVDGEYFTHLLYFRPWIWKFQVIQKNQAHLLFKVVRANGAPSNAELEEIVAKTRRVMGADCRVDFEFPAELPPHPGGKFRYTISEIADSTDNPGRQT
jgi:phenylacetate-CoA ligase